MRIKINILALFFFPLVFCSCEKDPDLEESSNCLLECPFLYYYNSYGKYKCSPTLNCPDESKLLIKEKKKCVDTCENEDVFSFLFQRK